MEDRAQRARALQSRIREMLRETPEEAGGRRFTPFMVTAGPDYESRLAQAAAQGGIEGIEAALDEFDRLAPQADRGRLRYALMIFLTHHPDVARLGLSIPPLEERSPWKLRSSRPPTD